MAPTRQTTAFTLHRWTNPRTTCDYPFLAVAEDESALLSLGNYGLCVDWDIPDESALWLAQDFAATGETISCDVSTVRSLLHATFADDADFLLVSFSRNLWPKGVELSLVSQKLAEDGPEYIVKGVGNYQRIHRLANWFCAVTPAESALLDACVATMTELAAQYGSTLEEPPPLRYRSSPVIEPVSERENYADEHEV